MARFKGVWLAIIFLLLATLACNLSSARQSEPHSAPAETIASSSAPTAAPLAPPTVQALTDAEEQLLIELYERANPAVVNIDVSTAAFGDDLNDFGSGSGFVIDDKGHIVTNNHVVESADDLRVTFHDGFVAKAEVIARDEDSDLAVLKVDVGADHLKPLEFGDSSSLRVGQRVVAIGNPWDLGGTMTVGIVSALGRSLPGKVTPDQGFYSIPDLIQTDAAINPGNSGGPLLDSSGRVVGINTAIRSEGSFNSGVGFAVPVDIVKRVVPALISEGRYHYPYLGITANGEVSVAELALELDLPVHRGVLIAEVRPGEPAAQAGLRGGNSEFNFYGQPLIIGGDIILSIDDYPLRDFDDLIAYLVRETSVGQQVTLTVMRDNETLEIPLTLGERP